MRETSTQTGGIAKVRALVKAIQVDPIYRHRLLHSAVIFWSFVGIVSNHVKKNTTFKDELCN